VRDIKHTFCVKKRPFPFPAWSTNPTSDPKGEKSCPIQSTWSQQITLSKAMRPNTEFTKSTVSHRLSECVRAWLPSGFKPKVTFFCLTWFNWADEDVLCCFNRNHKHPSAKSYYFQSLLSAEQATFILYFIRTHIHTQCETTHDCAHCCL